MQAPSTEYRSIAVAYKDAAAPKLHHLFNQKRYFCGNRPWTLKHQGALSRFSAQAVFPSQLQSWRIDKRRALI